MLNLVNVWNGRTKLSRTYLCLTSRCLQNQSRNRIPDSIRCALLETKATLTLGSRQPAPTSMSLPASVHPLDILRNQLATDLLTHAGAQRFLEQTGDGPQPKKFLHMSSAILHTMYLWVIVNAKVKAADVRLRVAVSQTINLSGRMEKTGNWNLVHNFSSRDSGDTKSVLSEIMLLRSLADDSVAKRYQNGNTEKWKKKKKQKLAKRRKCSKRITFFGLNEKENCNEKREL